MKNKVELKFAVEVTRSPKKRSRFINRLRTSSLRLARHVYRDCHVSAGYTKRLVALVSAPADSHEMVFEICRKS